MWERIQKLIDRTESRIALWVAIGGSSVMGVISAWLSGYSELIRPLGPFGWLLSGILGTILTLFTAWVLAKTVGAWSRNRAINRWQQQVDGFNPFDKEFTRRRLRLSDLSDPVTNHIDGKTFIDCDLIGPANLALIDHIHMEGMTFWDCDVMVIRPDIPVNNAVGARNFRMLGGRLVNTTVLIPENLVPVFEQMGVRFATFVRDEAEWPQLPKGTEAEKRP